MLSYGIYLSLISYGSAYLPYYGCTVVNDWGEIARARKKTRRAKYYRRYR